MRGLCSTLITAGLLTDLALDADTGVSAPEINL